MSVFYRFSLSVGCAFRLVLSCVALLGLTSCFISKHAFEMSRDYRPVYNPGGHLFEEDEDFARSYELYKKRREDLVDGKGSAVSDKRRKSRVSNADKRRIVDSLRRYGIRVADTDKGDMVNSEGIDLSRVKGARFIDVDLKETEKARAAKSGVKVGIEEEKGNVPVVATGDKEPDVNPVKESAKQPVADDKRIPDVSLAGEEDANLLVEENGDEGSSTAAGGYDVPQVGISDEKESGASSGEEEREDVEFSGEEQGLGASDINDNKGDDNKGFPIGATELDESAVEEAGSIPLVGAGEIDEEEEDDVDYLSEDTHRSSSDESALGVGVTSEEEEDVDYLGEEDESPLEDGGALGTGVASEEDDIDYLSEEDEGENPLSGYEGALGEDVIGEDEEGDAPFLSEEDENPQFSDRPFVSGGFSPEAEAEPEAFDTMGEGSSNKQESGVSVPAATVQDSVIGDRISSKKKEVSERRRPQVFDIIGRSFAKRKERRSASIPAAESSSARGDGVLPEKRKVLKKAERGLLDIISEGLAKRRKERSISRLPITVPSSVESEEVYERSDPGFSCRTGCDNTVGFYFWVDACCDDGDERALDCDSDEGYIFGNR